MDKKNTCGKCDFFVHDESNLGLCHFNPPRGTTNPGPDPYPAVKIDGVGCSHHSNRNVTKTK